ncbi:enoyl-CoA hydratase/isomerase family protein [Nocardia sp. NPDC001965]
MTAGILGIADANRVRTLTLQRPEVLNAFDEALYRAVAEQLRDAAADPEIAVVLLTGSGRAFCSGNDLVEMQAAITGPARTGPHGFTVFLDELIAFPKPLVCAVNGAGVGIGATILGFADLSFMASTARLKCPFTDLGVAPEAASSYLLPRSVGRQNAAWMLMSSEWIDAQEALEMGLVWKVCDPGELLARATEYAERLAAEPIASLVAVKRTITEALEEQIRAAVARELEQFDRLVGGAANAEGLREFAGRRGSGG